ncbi:MAG: hypothetical protein JRJ87_24150, partial [Deltaproteobacteria bacterium]|nr:hypothetical protein [Deltaproteobacteria bacterium]
MKKIHNNSRLFSFCLLGLLAGFLVGGLPGCKSGESNGQSKINGDDHLGWKNQHCEFCHTLPVKGHSEVDSPLCAACHG